MQTPDLTLDCHHVHKQSLLARQRSLRIQSHISNFFNFSRDYCPDSAGGLVFILLVCR